MQASFTACLLLFNLLFAQAQTRIWTGSGNSQSGLATYGVTFSADGKKVLSGSECHPANIRMFDAENGNLLWDYNVGNQFMCIQGVKFSSNGTYIASVEELGNILIFDNTGSTPVIKDTIKTGTSYAFSADFSPSSDRLVIGASNGKMNIYQVADGTLLKSVQAHSGYVFSVAYSLDGALIASGGSDNSLKVWTTDGILLLNLTGNADDINTVRFSPDNSLIITGGADGKITIRNTIDGSVVRIFQAHSQDIKQVDISTDGKKLVSTSNDGTCKIWDLASAQLLSTFGDAATNGIMWSAVWSPEGSRIATGSGSGEVILWDVSDITSTNQPQVDAIDVLLFPNPAQQFFRLKANSEISRISIYNVQGGLIEHLNPTALVHQVSAYQPGRYVVYVQFAEGVIKSMPLTIHR